MWPENVPNENVKKGKHNHLTPIQKSNNYTKISTSIPD